MRAMTPTQPRKQNRASLPPPPMPPVPVPDPLSHALDEAIAGRRDALFDLLRRGSRLPGPRHHCALADAFAQACRGRGKTADAVALAMAGLSADEAPGATTLEFLPLCGVLAIASRAAADEGVRSRFVTELHAHADDLRFRVRDAVVDGLTRIGSVTGDALVEDVASWMDGYFHAAAVLRALAQEGWLTNLHDAERTVLRLDEAFHLARDAPRAAARYPGHKSLLEVLQATPPRMAVRFGVPVFDMWTRWASVPDPVLRDLLRASLRDAKLTSRFRPELDRVGRELDATEPPPRNPDHDHGPSRDRSGERRRGRGR